MHQSHPRNPWIDTRSARKILVASTFFGHSSRKNCLGCRQPGCCEPNLFCKIIMLTTPSRVTSDIRRLCRRIGSIEPPEFVRVAARSDSEMDDCFMDVQKQVDEFGGEIQHGWTIWIWPGIFAEGEFHAVWRSPQGELVDVSRKKHRESAIMFAADHHRIFRERRVPNVRMAISNDPMVKQLFSLHDRYQKIVGDLMKDLPFGSKIVIEGQPVEIQKQIAHLQYLLQNSRDARRAQGT